MTSTVCGYCGDRGEVDNAGTGIEPCPNCCPPANTADEAAELAEHYASGGTGGQATEGDERKSASTVLVETAESLYRFGLATSGEVFAVPKSGPKVVAMLRGDRRSLRARLAREYFARQRKAPPQQALADALLVIEGMAQDRDPEPLSLRVARHDGALWLDLGDDTGRAARITSSGWTIEEHAPVLFRRTVLTSPLPIPVPGGDLGELWRLLNVADEDRPLLAAWLVAALIPEMPHPALGLFGEQGTGKTSAMRLAVSVVDPSTVPARKPPRDAESWVTAAAGSWVVGLDNLSDIPPWLSDSLCRAVTGDGDVRRKLYADADLVVFAFRRVLAFNGIDLGGFRGDLADRTLPLTLERIADSDRLDEDRLWPTWAEQHPRILGALLDLAAKVLRILPSVQLASKPRMADFARVLAAVDKAHGSCGLDRYLDKQGALAADSLDGDDFVTAIALVLDGERFEGTSAELLTLVTPAEDGWHPPKGWPGNARAVTTRLHRQAPVMRKAGWTVEEDKDGHDKTIRWTIARPTREARNPDPRLPRDPHGAGVAGVAGNESGPSPYVDTAAYEDRYPETFTTRSETP